MPNSQHICRVVQVEKIEENTENAYHKFNILYCDANTHGTNEMNEKMGKKSRFEYQALA